VTKRVERRLEVLCDDRFDVRIDASAYDKRAREIRQHQDQVRRRISERQATELPPVNQAVDVMALASKAANLFVEQPGAEQQKFLRLVFENASWKGGELRMSFRKPFSELSVSNRATRTNDDCLQRVEGDSGMWRGKRDSFGQGVCAFCNLQILRSGRRARNGQKCRVWVRIGYAAFLTAYRPEVPDQSPSSGPPLAPEQTTAHCPDHPNPLPESPGQDRRGSDN